MPLFLGIIFYPVLRRPVFDLALFRTDPLLGELIERVDAARRR